jgi:dephospho-CoA kinase
MIKLAVVGDIGSGKSYLAKQFSFPVFNADIEVNKIYNKSKKCYTKLKKILPNYINSFPIKKSEISAAIMGGSHNLSKIVKIVHPEVRSKMNFFIKKNKNKKFIVLDIPLLLENKINNKKDIIIYVEANKKEINKRLKKRYNINLKIIRKFRQIQLSPKVKKSKANIVIKNNFKKSSCKKNIKIILEKILSNV